MRNFFFDPMWVHKFKMKFIIYRKSQTSTIIPIYMHVKCDRDSSYARVLNRNIYYIILLYILYHSLCILHELIIMYENSMNHVLVNSAAMSNELYAIAATWTQSTTMLTLNDDMWWYGEDDEWAVKNIKHNSTMYMLYIYLTIVPYTY